jgi:hypothetical protein
MRNPLPDFTLDLTFMLPASFHCALAVGIHTYATAGFHAGFNFHVAGLLSLVSRSDPYVGHRLL